MNIFVRVYDVFCIPDHGYRSSQDELAAFFNLAAPFTFSSKRTFSLLFFSV
jgi:hypothetical protein